MEENMGTLLRTDEKKEVDKITNLIKCMDSTDKNSMLAYMNGFVQDAKFLESLMPGNK